jgi:hypothetical protein
MSPAIALCRVLIHWELMPRGKLIRSKVKKRARRRPILDLPNAPVVQLKVDAFLVMLRSPGYGLFVGFVLRTMWRAAQYLMIMVTNSRTLIEMSQPSTLSCFYRSVHSLTSSGNGRCHQKPREREYPPAPLRQMSKKVMNVGILGIM